jgi:hypothetical protein
MIAYCSHAMSSPLDAGPAVWRRHKADVDAWVVEVARSGFAVIVPQILPGLTHRQAMARDHELVRLSDVVVVHPSKWTSDSRGVAQEIRWARENGIIVAYSLRELRHVVRERRRRAA